MKKRQQQCRAPTPLTWSMLADMPLALRTLLRGACDTVVSMRMHVHYEHASEVAAAVF